MLALIRMDWTLNRRMFIFMSPIFFLWTSGPIVSPHIGMALFPIFLIASIAVFLPLIPFLGPTSPEAFLGALPVSRGQIVNARYLASLGTAALGLGLSSGLAAIFRNLGIPGMPVGLASGHLMGIAFLAALVAGGIFLLLPFFFRFGGERGLGLWFAAMATIPAGLLIFFPWPELLEKLPDLLERLTQGGRPLALALLGTSALGIASWRISLHAYRRRTATVQAPFFLPFLLPLALLAVLVVALRGVGSGSPGF